MPPERDVAGSDDSPPEWAHSLAVAVCRHGTVQLHFSRADGEVFAVAGVDPDAAEDIADKIRRAIVAAREIIDGKVTPLVPRSTH